MNRMREIEEYVAQGFVLDDHGNWVPLAQRANKEREFLKHLMIGEVLDGSAWTNLAIARQSSKNPVSEPAATVEPAESGTADTNAPQSQIPGFAPETVYAEVEEGDDDAVDVGLPVEDATSQAGVSEETVSIADKPSRKLPESFKNNALSPEFSNQSGADFEEDEWGRSHRRRQRIVLFVGIGIAALGGAAAALLPLLF